MAINTPEAFFAWVSTPLIQTSVFYLSAFRRLQDYLASCPIPRDPPTETVLGAVRADCGYLHTLGMDTTVAPYEAWKALPEEAKEPHDIFWVARDIIRIGTASWHLHSDFFLPHIDRKQWAAQLPHEPTEPQFRAQPLVAHYSTRDKWRRDVQTIVKVGKYLGTHNVPIAEIPALVEDYKRKLGLYGQNEVHITNDPDEIEWVYENGPHSCMQRGQNYLKSEIHPSRVYATDNTAVAYLRDGDASVVARAVLATQKKQFARCYGEGDRALALEAQLLDLGYEKTPHALRGCVLAAIPYDSGYTEDEDVYIVPYLDMSPQYVRLVRDDDNNEVIGLQVTDGYARGTVGASTTTGYLDLRSGEDKPPSLQDEEDDDDENYRDCECCGDRTYNEDLRYSDYHSLNYCESCAESEWIYAITTHRGDEDYVSSSEVVAVVRRNGHVDYYLDRSDILSDHEVVYSEVTDEYYYEDATTYSHELETYVPDERTVTFLTLTDTGSEVEFEGVDAYEDVTDSPTHLWVHWPTGTLLSDEVADALDELEDAGPIIPFRSYVLYHLWDQRAPHFTAAELAHIAPLPGLPHNSRYYADVVTVMHSFIWAPANAIPWEPRTPTTRCAFDLDRYLQPLLRAGFTLDPHTQELSPPEDPQLAFEFAEAA